MRRTIIALSITFAVFTGRAAIAQDAGEIAELRQMIDALRADYEQRIEELEARLAAAESAAQVPAAPVVTASTASVGSGNAFNPQTSVILNGNFYRDDVDGEGTELLANANQPSAPGHDHGDRSHGGTSNGFNLSEAELAFSAAVDPYFDAAAFLAIDGEGDVHLEEAWFQTRSLPYGLKLKGGKFLSDFGYINNQHPHQWDFADQNLAYLNLLGDHGLQDVGVQLSWLPDMPVYTLLGVELLQGDQERLGALVEDDEERDALGLAEQDDGPRLLTTFARISPELGYDHALQLGASWVHARQHQEIHGHPEEYTGLADPQEYGLEGDADLLGLDLVYKFDDAAPYGHRDFKLQLEYLYSMKDLEVTGGADETMGSSRKFTTDGLYVQGLYGLAPRWQAGLRYDSVGLTNRIKGDEREEFDSSDRWTLALTWLPTEFSTLRLQYEYSDITLQSGDKETFNTLWLQFLMSMGAHGAHGF